MFVTVLKSKIHNAFVTEANIDYIGSITIDEDLMDAAGLIEGEQVHVISYRDGVRLITYVITGPRGSGVICMNGPAALKIKEGDKVIVLAYAMMSASDAKAFKPTVIFPTPENRIS
jgi:aspartate 1-decarboxylase